MQRDCYMEIGDLHRGKICASMWATIDCPAIALPGLNHAPGLPLPPSFSANSLLVHPASRDNHHAHTFSKSSTDPSTDPLASLQALSTKSLPSLSLVKAFSVTSRASQTVADLGALMVYFRAVRTASVAPSGCSLANCVNSLI